MIAWAAEWAQSIRVEDLGWDTRHLRYTDVDMDDLSQPSWHGHCPSWTTSYKLLQSGTGPVGLTGRLSYLLGDFVRSQLRVSSDGDHPRMSIPDQNTILPRCTSGTTLTRNCNRHHAIVYTILGHARRQKIDQEAQGSGTNQSNQTILYVYFALKLQKHCYTIVDPSKRWGYPSPIDVVLRSTIS